MKVLDVNPFHEGLRRNIGMLNRLAGEMTAIEIAVEGLVAMDDSLKGQGGDAIRTFYNDCHLPFLRYFKAFKSYFERTLMEMDTALDGLESDANGFIREAFLEGDIEDGLREISQDTSSLTDEANDIMGQVADIVSLPKLDDSDVQEAILEARRKRDQTVSDLNEFDAVQTRALATIESDLQTMATWISNIEGLFTDGVTAIDFPMEKWMDLTAKSMLKTDLTQAIGALGGIAGMVGLDDRPGTTLGALLVGGGTIEFGYNFVNGLGNLFGFTMPILPSMSTRARPIKVQKELTTEEKQLQDLYVAIEAGQKGQPEYVHSDSRPIDPNTGDYLMTHESMRRVLGGNGSGTIDGFAPYAQGALGFLFEDIGILLNPDATLEEKALSAAFMFKPLKTVDTLHDVAKSGDKVRDVGKANKGIDNSLLPGEGKVGTYEELIDAGTRGDNITPHHMPSAKYMQTKAEVHKNDGVSMNMEHPHPGKGGRHRQTETYGVTGKKLEDYLNLGPRDALTRDIIDARNIYIKEGLYTPEIRSGLLEVIKSNKTKYPNIFEKQ